MLIKSYKRNLKPFNDKLCKQNFKSEVFKKYSVISIMELLDTPPPPVSLFKIDLPKIRVVVWQPRGKVLFL